MSQLNELIILLQRKFIEHSYEEIEVIIEKIREMHDSSSIELLIKFLDDDFEYDEIMFSIIHCIEDFEDSVYVKAILNAIPDFIFKSPRWASIIHMRILNNDSTLNAYVREYNLNTSYEQKMAIRKLLEAINSLDPEFSIKTASIINIMS